MNEQIDIAVDLGVVPPPLPEILSLRQLVEVAPAPPHEAVEGVSAEAQKGPAAHHGDDTNRREEPLGRAEPGVHVPAGPEAWVEDHSCPNGLGFAEKSVWAEEKVGRTGEQLCECTNGGEGETRGFHVAENTGGRWLV